MGQFEWGRAETPDSKYHDRGVLITYPHHHLPTVWWLWSWRKRKGFCLWTHPSLNCGMYQPAASDELRCGQIGYHSWANVYLSYLNQTNGSTRLPSIGLLGSKSSLSRRMLRHLVSCVLCERTGTHIHQNYVWRARENLCQSCHWYCHGGHWAIQSSIKEMH